MSVPRFLRTSLLFDELDSTSTHARRLLADTQPELPLLIRARRQTAGRGRGSNPWWSAEGSLTFTLALDPSAHGLRPEHEPRLALAGALALIDAIGRCDPGPDPGIRWPNDVEAGDRKLAGFLPERVETPNGPRLLLGVGVNVTCPMDRAPAAIRAMATTVAEIGGLADADRLLSRFLAEFADALPRLAAGDERLARRWRELDQLLNRPVDLAIGDKRVRGLGRGIDALGGLLIESDGEPRPYYGGQVSREGFDGDTPRRIAPG